MPEDVRVHFYKILLVVEPVRKAEFSASFQPARVKPLRVPLLLFWRITYELSDSCCKRSG